MIDDKKVLLVLGGLAQVCDIVEDAKKKGVYVIVADYLESSPAKKMADESHMISITDVEGIVQLCKERHVDGVMNYCIDPGQKPYQKICEQLGFPCYGTKEQFDIMTNKDLFKETCIKNGVGVVQSYHLDNDCEIENLDFPVVIKPADGRASKGITICHYKEDVPLAIRTAMSYSKRSKVICERHVKKPEVAVKYFVCNSRIFLTSMSDIYTSYTGETRNYIWTQTFPSKFYDMYKETTDLKVRNMIRNIGIQNGPLSFSGFVDNGDFLFIDPSFRMGGAQDWRIVAKITGVNISELLTNFALNGDMGDCDEICRIDGKFAEMSSAMLYFLVRDGKIAKINGIKDAVKIKSVIGYHMTHLEGDIVKNLGTSDHVAIRFLIVSKNNYELKRDIVRIQKLIQISDDSGNDMLLKNFDVNLIDSTTNC